MTWGRKGFGVNTSLVADLLQSEVNTVIGTDSAFAALKADGSVAWQCFAILCYFFVLFLFR